MPSLGSGFSDRDLSVQANESISPIDVPEQKEPVTHKVAANSSEHSLHVSIAPPKTAHSYQATADVEFNHIQQDYQHAAMVPPSPLKGHVSKVTLDVNFLFSIPGIFEKFVKAAAARVKIEVEGIREDERREQARVEACWAALQNAFQAELGKIILKRTDHPK